MKQMQIIPPEIKQAIERVVNYNWREEHDDYVTSSEERKRTHIFKSLGAIREWLDSEEKTILILSEEK